MPEPLISLIVPVYNSADTIAACLRSLCHQTYKNLEILVVYLKSNDGTLEIIQSVSDKRLKIIEQTEKTGPGGARNIGLLHATGSWIGFAEADDFVDTDFYEKLLRTALETQSDIVQGEILSKNKIWCACKAGKIYSTVSEKYSLIKNGASFNKLFRADLIRSHAIHFTEIFRYEDNPFLFKAFYFANKIATVRGPKYHYNAVLKGSSYKNFLSQSVLPITSEIINFLEKHLLSQREKNIAKRQLLESFAGSYLCDPEIYPQLKNLMGNPFFLRAMRLKKIFKNLKKTILHRKRKEHL